MTTEWFDRKPGEGGALSTTEPGVLLVGNPRPDWVRLPPELGGVEVRVLDSKPGLCPVCLNHDCQHLQLDAEVNVAECPARGFLWYRRRTP